VKPEPSTADALALRAMDRVLAAEREASLRIAACERHCQEQLERARTERHAILERAQQRIVALHARAAKALEERSAVILKTSHPAPAVAAPQHEQVQAALAQLVNGLITGAS
jgi:hypothetical protein